ncbi:MAG TPA: hypothetical protein VIF82_13025 [Burkholderiaceae bacterium]|jgi:hypothetical protein
MLSLLHYITEITRNRDHALLDFSVISALYQITGARQVRALDIVHIQTMLFIQKKVWVENGKVMSFDDQETDPDEKEPLSRYPVLVDCIQQKKSEAEEVRADGMTISGCRFG